MGLFHREQVVWLKVFLVLPNNEKAFENLQAWSGLSTVLKTLLVPISSVLLLRIPPTFVFFSLPLGFQIHKMEIRAKNSYFWIWKITAISSHASIRYFGKIISLFHFILAVLSRGSHDRTTANEWKKSNNVLSILLLLLDARHIRNYFQTPNFKKLPGCATKIVQNCSICLVITQKREKIIQLFFLS